MTQLEPDLFQLTVEAGQDVGLTHASRGALVTVGRHGKLALSDKDVSRLHCAVEVLRRRLIVRDLDSANGTQLDGVTILEACARPGSILLIGNTRIRIDVGPSVVRPLGDSSADELQPLIDGTRSWRSQRDDWMRYVERKYVESALIATSRNIAEAARLAGVNRVSFYRMMWRVGLR